MLIKDGKEYNLDAPENKAELEAFLKAMPEFNEKKPVVVKYHSSLIKYDPLNHKNVMPSGRGIPFRQVINRKGKGNQTWIYCQNYELDKTTGAMLTRTPWRLLLAGSKMIDWASKDLAFFLWLSPFCGNGENTRDRSIYVFEDKEGEATRQLQVDRLQSRVKSMVMNDEEFGGLTDQSVHEYCRAYQLRQGMGINEARQELYRSISRDGIKGHQKFLALLENPEEKAQRILLKRAKEAGVLRCSGLRIEKGTGFNYAWKIVDRDGEIAKVFAKHKKLGVGVTDHESFLIKSLTQEPEILKKIQLAVEASEVQVV